MKRIILILFLLAYNIGMIVAGEDVHQSAKVSQFPSTVGAYDWERVEMPVEDGSYFVSLLSGKEGIYYRVVVKDRALQMRFLMRGMTIYVDPKGKKKKKYSVVYPTIERPKREGRREGRGERGAGMHPGEMMPLDGARRGDTLVNDLAQRGPGKRDPERAKRRKAMLEGMIKQLTGKPVTLKAGKDEVMLSNSGVSSEGNNIVYYGEIPYSIIGEVDKKGILSLCISQEAEESDSDVPFGPHPGMMMRGFHGMMPGGMPPRMGQNDANSEKMQKMSEKIEIWLHYSI